MSALATPEATPPTPVSAADAPRTLASAFRFFARHASPRILAALFGAAFVLRLLAGPPGWLDAAVAAAILALWTFNEWLIHVFILHFRPRRIGRFTIDPAVSRKHRAHHRDPRNLEILFIPLQSFVLAVPLLVGLAFLLAPNAGVALTAIAVYLALAPKSIAVYRAEKEVRRALRERPAEPVPLQIRNAPTDLMKSLDYGSGYRYAPDLEDGVGGLECLPDSLVGSRFYEPTDRGFEAELGRRMEDLAARRERARSEVNEPERRSRSAPARTPPRRRGGRRE